MFRNVLVAFDGSVPSLRGLKAALALARDQDAMLHVVHVIDPSTVARSYEGEIYLPQKYVDAAIEDQRETGRKVLAKAEALARREGQAIRTLLVDTRGESVAHAIVRAAKKARAELIVVGTHGRRGLRRAVLGSDAEAVLREAPVPVLVVRAEPRDMMRISKAGGKGAGKGGAERGRVDVVAAGPAYP